MRVHSAAQSEWESIRKGDKDAYDWINSNFDKPESAFAKAQDLKAGPFCNPHSYVKPEWLKTGSLKPVLRVLLVCRYVRFVWIMPARMQRRPCFLG